MMNIKEKFGCDSYGNKIIKFDDLFYLEDGEYFLSEEIISSLSDSDTVIMNDGTFHFVW